MSTGWIKIYREIEEWSLWFDESFTYGQAWIDLLLLANHKDGTVNIRGNIIPVKRGQVCRSEEYLAKRWRWSRNKLRRYLRMLKMRQQIEQQKTIAISLITIINYSKYQENDTTDETTEGTTERRQKDDRRYTYKNDKKKKNEKEWEEEKTKYLDFVLLTEPEYEKLGTELSESGRAAYIDRLNNYIGSKGAKYKSHYHTILAWYRKDTKDKKPVPARTVIDLTQYDALRTTS